MFFSDDATGDFQLKRYSSGGTVKTTQLIVKNSDNSLTLGSTSGSGTGALYSGAITSSGQLKIGTTATPSSTAIYAVINQASNAGGLQLTSSNNGGVVFIPNTTGGLSTYIHSGAIGAETYTLAYTLSNTGAATFSSTINSGAITSTGDITILKSSTYGALQVTNGINSGSYFGYAHSGGNYSTTSLAGDAIVRGYSGIDFDINGNGVMRIASTGAAIFSSTVNTTSTAASNSTVASNSIYTTGGIGVTGASIFSSTTASSSTSTGAVVISGGLGIGGAAYFGGNVTGLAFFESSSILKKNITKRYKGVDGGR